MTPSSEWLGRFFFAWAGVTDCRLDVHFRPAGGALVETEWPAPWPGVGQSDDKRPADASAPPSQPWSSTSEPYVGAITAHVVVGRNAARPAVWGGIDTCERPSERVRQPDWTRKACCARIRVENQQIHFPGGA